jgi:hypothetical protein
MKSKYTFSGNNKITTSKVDGNYIWLAFYGINSVCLLYKSSIFNPNIIYWDLNIIADEITSIVDDSTNIYLSLDYNTYIGTIVNKSNPTTITYCNKPVGIAEKAIDIINNTTYLYFLTPGIALGENAKIIKFTLAGIYVETVDLTTVTNAKKIDIDSAGNIWVQSDLDTIPKIIKIWYDTFWHYTVYTLS